MRKIAIFTGDLRTFSGGARYVIDLTNRMKKFDITVFAYNRPRKYRRITTKELKRLTNAKIVTYNNPELSSRETLELTWGSMKAFFSSRNFDVIYNINPSFIPNLIHLILFKIYGKKLILAAHSPRTFRCKPVKDTILNRFLWKFYAPLRDKIFMSIPNIHVLNINDLEYLRRVGYKHKIYYIPNFINTSLIPQKLQINKNDFIVLFVGRLKIFDKGIDLLSDVIDKTIIKSQNIKFQIIGSREDGEEAVKNLVKKYPKNIKWLGFVSNDKLAESYKKASIMISTSRLETFPLNVLEAQSNGLPVIAFDINGIRDVVKKNYQGSLIPKFSTDKFAEQIYEYYQKWCRKDISVSLKEKISSDAVKRYGSENIFRLLEKMFNES